MADASPERLSDGRYEVRQLIGRGGMAEVHLGYDLRLSRNVAIKMLRTDLARDAIFLARFRREAQAAASLNHPNIVAVYDTGERTVIVPDGTSVSVPYIIMEYVEGHTVHELLTDGQPVPIEEAIEIISGVLNALEFSHAHGLVHRDIKPGNVMLTMSGEVKVMDFGIARALEDSGATMTQTDAVVGTAQYLSPEQARGEQVDTRSDLYSAGCMLFELLTGRPPFRGDSAVAVAYQHVSEAPPLASSITLDISDALDRVLMKALAKRPIDRYQDAASMRRDLIAAGRGSTIQAPPIDTWEANAGRTRQMAATRVNEPFQRAREKDVTNPLTLERPRPTDANGSRRDEDRRRTRHKRVLWSLVALLFVAVLGVGGVLAYQSLLAKPDEVRIPNTLISQSMADAEAQLKELGLGVREGDPVASNSVDADLVAQTDPPAGTMVPVGSVVTLHPSSGPASVTIPDLRGQSQEQARKTLESLKLKVGNVTQEDAPKTDAGSVLRSSPSAGSQVAEGDSVDLVLASGYVSIDESQIVGRGQDEAVAYLNNLGLAANTVTQQSSDAQPGTVMSISASGHIKIGTRVTITIAQRPPEPTTPASPSPTTPSTDAPDNNSPS
ncbi:Stk1 family PASTA domain-containing Ser/Thr kinase [Nanchangia anserum]|uniref:non-specific serine/threonine protein kinase n=1 Tax=Nanchangia anserum TaxID=2692125 RepID=A0A8I0GE03_9ACTO|nr:Stk1 family PASTA domain-containing Ser/Thr kinase [Nanchangia anserum]MBD3689793.1 Stk1 family PASTA domain-containing Ser/Thr kinase [Nanchangia anserum]QOX81967.1 Stk1 family PASTA domain-containing Ser/Thr kinase [Nanchangia anserum]